ncbi:HAD-IA family hydrolase [Oceanicella actignis]|uniref:HAD-IA family hydrolase n=1 Tax=Oceanicella actignis TaxID=1189325 RepID=UPI0011E739BB|nr:HAD-IA family hydrolase [Oceanicella actignis]TYO88282.1 phosphoglycolate phosphatase [Oceanicella actignis]
MTAPLRLAVFDVDGTLMDSQEFIIEAMRRGFAAAGLAAPEDSRILSIVGLSLVEAVSALAPDLPPAEAERVAALYKRSFIDLRADKGGEASAPLYPGAREALERLAARDEVFLGVATGKARRGLDHALRAHGLGHFFHTTHTADEHPSKPHPDMLLGAMRRTGVAAEAAVMIGDTTFDVAMARAAGMAAIGVAWGYHDAESLRQAGAAAVIDRFEDLDDALHALWQARGATA